MRSGAKCTNWGSLGHLGVSQGHRQCHHSFQCNIIIKIHNSKKVKICYVCVCTAHIIKNRELSFCLSNSGAENTKLWLAAVHEEQGVIIITPMRAFI